MAELPLRFVDGRQKILGFHRRRGPNTRNRCSDRWENEIQTALVDFRDRRVRREVEAVGLQNQVVHDPPRRPFRTATGRAAGGPDRARSEAGSGAALGSRTIPWNAPVVAVESVVFATVAMLEVYVRMPIL